MNNIAQNNASLTQGPNQRIMWVDILKGIAILLVVTGHIPHPGGDLHPARHLIYSFHMGLFFLLSEYTCAFSFSRHPSIRLHLQKRLLTVLLPYIVWCVLSPLFFCWREGLEGYSLSGACLNILFPPGQLWFLPCLFIMHLLFVIYQLLHRVVPAKGKSLCSALCVFLLVYLNHRYCMPLLQDHGYGVSFLNPSFSMSFFFAFGAMLFYSKRSLSTIVRSETIAACSLLAFALLGLCYHEVQPVYARIVTGFAACIVLLKLFVPIDAAKISATKASRWIFGQLIFIGKNTMVIFITSRLIQPYYPPLVSDPETAAFAVFVCHLFAAIIVSYACIGIRKAINTSRIMSLLLLGEISPPPVAQKNAQ